WAWPSSVPASCSLVWVASLIGVSPFSCQPDTEVAGRGRREGARPTNCRWLAGDRLTARQERCRAAAPVCDTRFTASRVGDARPRTRGCPRLATTDGGILMLAESALALLGAGALGAGGSALDPGPARPHAVRW